MTVIVCGSRYWNNRAIIRKVLQKLPEDTVVIHGAARGADSLAGLVALQLGFKVRPYPADWAKHGKMAGPIRNALMVKEGKPDRVIAFHNHINDSLGTKDMVNRARKLGIPVELFKEE